MQQIQLFIKQRFLQQQELLSLNWQNKQSKFRQQYLNREKSRVQKENWNIKLLKNMKIPSLQTKHNIYNTMKRSVDLYSKKYEQSSENVNFLNIAKEDKIDQQDLRLKMEHFTQQFINLLVNFYNKNRQKIDPDTLRLIVRPNNNFIIVDLIKSFIEFTRSRFKRALEQAKLPSQNARTQISTTCFLPPRFSINKKVDISSKYLTEQSKIQMSYQVFDNELSFKAEKQTILFEKCNKFLNQMNCNQIQQKINLLFLSLLRLNEANKNMIAGFKDSCYGKRRNIAYNIFGLYSQQEKSTMMKKLQSDISQYQNVKPLAEESSPEQFKDRFKKYVQLQERKQKYFSKTEDKLHPYLSLKLQECPNQIQPLRIMVVSNNNQLVPMSKFSKENKKVAIPQFLRQKLNRNFDEKGMCKYLQSDKISKKRIRKELFFDINKKGVRQLLLMDKVMVKKESLLPFLKSSDSKQKRMLTQTRQREMSQRKLGPLKSYQLNNMKKPFLKRAGMCSQSKISASCKGDKSRQSTPYNFITREKHLSANNI